jgi:hypothetical protein
VSVPAFSPPGNGSGAASPTPVGHPPHPLDALSGATTAFDQWADLLAAMSAGYTPTVYADGRRKRLLIRAVHAAGFRTWPPAEARKAVRA